MTVLALAAVLASFALGMAVAQATSALPIVDLGYERHQAITYNETGDFYNFTNIRYAQPPVGDLRFRAPVPPAGKNSAVNNGSTGVICPQAGSAWTLIAEEFMPAYLAGQPFNLSAAEAGLQNIPSPAIDPRTTEDCLFLDVVVPKKIFEKPVKSYGGAPVLVWIYGGGYTEGEKGGAGLYNPAGLIKASKAEGGDGIVYVAMNYRLGAFGWLAGPSLQADGVANAGLYDQRLALDWVQQNIHLFGGDKTKVTIMGESAGGGSIMHQITAFGGLNGPAPFARAIPQSPGFRAIPSSFEQEETLQAFLGLLNVSTIEEARQLPSAALIQANAGQVASSTYGTFTYGPVMDGLFAPALPGKLLSQGSFHKDVKVLVGHNSDEGLLFTNPAFANPAFTNDTLFGQFIQQMFPSILVTIFNYITTTLYPQVFDGSYPYKTQFERALLATAEAFFTCNTYYLDRAFGNATYAYEFAVFPGIHGEDVPYTFANGNNPSIANLAIATAMQEYFTSFAINGVPKGQGIPRFPLYGAGSDAIEFNATSIHDIRDESANSRCLWWQKALYY